MQVSARILGRDYGVTAEEMNRILFKQGFLSGEPGDYGLTEKVLPYAVSKNFHRGTAGYSCYNRDWTTRTYDDSIKQALNVTADVIKEVRDELSKERAARYAAQTTARAQANASFLAKQAAEKAAKEAAERVSLDAIEMTAKLKNAGKIGLVVSGVAGSFYGVYKAVPKVKQWWNERKQTDERIEPVVEINNEGEKE